MTKISNNIIDSYLTIYNKKGLPYKTQKIHIVNYILK